MNDKYIIYFISKTKKKMIKFLERKLKQNALNDLIPSHGNILTVLYENGGKLTMKEIAKLIGKDKSTITLLVNKLYNLGYIEKEKNEKDNRITFIVLSKKGWDIQPKFNSISNEVLETAYRGFTVKEKKIFLKLLKKMNNNFNLK